MSYDDHDTKEDKGGFSTQITFKVKQRGDAFKGYTDGKVDGNGRTIRRTNQKGEIETGKEAFWDSELPNLTVRNKNGVYKRTELITKQKEIDNIKEQQTLQVGLSEELYRK